MIALSLMMGVLVASLSVARTGQHKAEAGRTVADASRIASEVRRLYSTAAQAGYTGLTASALRTAGADLEDLWVPTSTAYRAAAGLVTLAPSNRIPGGTGSAGDGYSMSITGLKPESCQSVVDALGRTAVYITAVNSASVSVEITGVPGAPTPSTVLAACNRPPAVTLTLHFN